MLQEGTQESWKTIKSQYIYSYLYIKVGFFDKGIEGMWDEFIMHTCPYMSWNQE